MHVQGYGLSELIADLRVIVADAANTRELLEQARPLVEWVSGRPARWLSTCRFETDSHRGFGTVKLHEEPGDGLSICAIAWPPGGHVLPHLHRCWEILSPVYGAMRHCTWMPPGGASKPRAGEIEKGCEVLLQPGQAVALMRHEIHSLESTGPGPGFTMHVYGCGLAEVEHGRFATESD